MEFAGEEVALIPGILGMPPARDKNKVKDPKVWLAGELIVRCERQHLTALPPELFLKATLRKLVLTGNELDSLPVEIFQQLKDLRELRAGHNRITYLPEEVHQLPHLEHLDLQHNRLKLVPASLYRCVRLTVLNLNGNPLCSWSRELWPEQPTATAATAAAAADRGSSAGSGSPGDSADAGSRSSAAAASAGELQQLKANTQALLEHLLQEQDPAAQAEVAQARLLVQQEAARARLHKQLHVLDADSLAECHRLATSAQLGQDILGQVQELQAAAQVLQAAVDAVQLHQQQQHQDATQGVPAGAQAELAASLHRVEGLCKPGKPAGKLYLEACSLSRRLTRQQLEHGWRCAPQQPPAAAAATGAHNAGTAAVCDPAAAPAAAAAGSDGAGALPRRFLTSAERVRQQLAGSGAKRHKEWAALKQQQEQQQKQKLKERAKAEAAGHVQAVAERAAKAVQDCDREQHWPSKRTEAFPPGTFSLTPDALRAVRKAYHKGPPLAPRQGGGDAGDDEGGDAS